MTKYCGSCQKNLDADRFNKNRNTFDGLQTECRGCKKKRYRTANPIKTIGINEIRDEKWKEITDTNYSTSSIGRIRSNRRSEIRTDGRIFNFDYKLVRLHKNKKSGYLSFLSGFKGKRLYVHRVVAKAFIANPENKRCINHKNGIKTDNRIDNLEWCTHSENMNHAYSIGLKMGHRLKITTSHSHLKQQNEQQGHV